MNILVYLKPVLKSDAISLHPVKKKLTVSSKEKFLSHDDLAALELAIQLKEANGARVTAITCGGNDADVLLRQAVGMGADQGILVKCSANDSYAVADAVAAEVRKQQPDLVFTGMTCANKDLECTGNLAAVLAGYRQVSGISAVRWADRLLGSRENRGKLQHAAIPDKTFVFVTGDVAVRYMHASRVFCAYDDGLVTTVDAENQEHLAITVAGYEPRLSGREKKIAEGTEEELVRQIVDYLKACGVLAKGGDAS